jgi:SAM-dependent methyltransferase
MPPQLLRRVLEAFLSEPPSGVPLDDPRTLELRAEQLRSPAKRFLRLIYDEWADRLLSALPPGPGRVLELGSGAGLLADRVLGLIRTDVLAGPGLDLVMDARELALSAGSLRGILLCNVLHHVADAERFLHEAARCLRRGGVLAMVEPWVTPWSSLVWRTVAHEPFRPDGGWSLDEATGPLSGANVALPWILFARDRAELARRAPQLQLRRLDLFMPFRYLLSGGFSRRGLAPAWSFSALRRLEQALSPLSDSLAMFAQIELVRVA